MIEFQDELVEAAWQSYIILLRFPISIRLKYQDVLVKLRDEIAKSMNTDSESVQSMAELIVIDQGGII